MNVSGFRGWPSESAARLVHSPVPISGQLFLQNQPNRLSGGSRPVRPLGELLATVHWMPIVDHDLHRSRITEPVRLLCVPTNVTV